MLDKVPSRLEQDDPTACEQLIPLLYSELRKLAASHLSGERLDHSLSATALLHEAYLRLKAYEHYENRLHFYRAASQAMRHVLIDNARRRKRSKRGGDLKRAPFDLALLPLGDSNEELLSLDEALAEFAEHHARQAQLVELRFFGGLTLEEAADALGISLSTADRDWKYARAWLYAAMKD